MGTMENRREGFSFADLMVGSFVGAVLIMVTFGVLALQKKASDAQADYIDAIRNTRSSTAIVEKTRRISASGIDGMGDQPEFIRAVFRTSDIGAGESSGERSSCSTIVEDAFFETGVDRSCPVYGRLEEKCRRWMDAGSCRATRSEDRSGREPHLEWRLHAGQEIPRTGVPAGSPAIGVGR